MKRRPCSPVPVLPTTRAWPLHGAAASREMEAAAAAQLPPHTLMARAGTAVTRMALALAPRARRMLVLAGPGNNGGDALLAAALLHDAGVDICAVMLADPERLPADARWALTEARTRTPLQIMHTLPQAWTADLVIDGLLGLGLTRAPTGVLAEAISAVNAQAGPVLSIDVPSGLDSDHGTTFDGTAVRASHTLSLLSLKPGLFTCEGRDYAGHVWFDDLAVDPALTAVQLAGPTASGARAPHAAHKGRFGDLTIIGGAPGMCGAAWLAAHAGLAAGAGRVYVGMLDGRILSSPPRAELMQRDVDVLLTAAHLLQSTVVAGCGGGHEVRAALPALLAHAGRLVLDADALNAIAADDALRAALKARAQAGCRSVLTPHPLEAARLLGCEVSRVQADRLSAAHDLAEHTGAVVVLKGSGTVVAAPGGALTVHPVGNARLSTAGTGDVLAGWLGGLWSRHAASTATVADLAAIAGAAVTRHGQAAEQTPGQGPLLAADLITAMQQGI